MAKKIDQVVTYKVWYKLNPEYEGTFQVDKIGGGGLHATVTPSMGGMSRAMEEAARVKTWFNEEKVAVEKSTARGKKEVEVKTTFHNNVIVWVEKYLDGYSTEEELSCPEKAVPLPPKPSVEVEIESLRAQVAEMKDQLMEKYFPTEAPKPKGKKVKEEDLAGV